MKCSGCGRDNPDGANFCAVCGSSLIEHSEQETTVIYGIGAAADEAVGKETEFESDNPALIVERGPNAGTKFAVADARVTIGRHPDSDFFLDDVTVSRRHAEVRQVDDGYVLVDVGSLNGTYVNGERVERVDLHDGDEFRVGKYVIVFVAGTDCA